jgi:hypothetical protein
MSQTNLSIGNYVTHLGVGIVNAIEAKQPNAPHTLEQQLQAAANAFKTIEEVGMCAQMNYRRNAFTDAQKDSDASKKYGLTAEHFLAAAICVIRQQCSVGSRTAYAGVDYDCASLLRMP